MKTFKSLLETVGPKIMVYGFGAFQPGNSSDAILINTVKTLAKKQNAAYSILVDDTATPLSVESKLHYLKLMYPNTNFVPANTHSITDSPNSFLGKYQLLILVTTPDNVSKYEHTIQARYINKFAKIEMMAVKRPVSDYDKDLVFAAKNNNFDAFKHGFPPSISSLDVKHLMNDIRVGLGLDKAKEPIALEHDSVREDYFNNKLFEVYDIVKSDDEIYLINKCGANHLLLQNESGELVSKWLKDVMPIEESGMRELDKTKVAKIIALALNVADDKTTTNPSAIINSALMNAKSKNFTQKISKPVIVKLLQIASNMGIYFDKNLIEDVAAADTSVHILQKLYGKNKGPWVRKYHPRIVTFAASGQNSEPETGKYDVDRDDANATDPGYMDKKLGKLYDKTRKRITNPTTG